MADAPNPELLSLLCDQGKFEEAEALVDHWVARIDWEIEQADHVRLQGDGVA